MRVVGGKKDERGTLGAFVTMVTSDGPASTQGIQIGKRNIHRLHFLTINKFCGYR